MANHKSAKKRIKQSATKRLTNRWKTSRVRTEIKKLRTAIETKDKDAALALLPQVQALLDRLAKSSALKRGTAARKNSRLASQVAKL